MKFLFVALSYFSALRPNNSLSTPVSNVLYLCSSANRQATQHNTASTTALVAATGLVLQLYSPSSSAPAISKAVPKQHACFTVRTFAPTDVANEFGTLLAPMPKAKMNPTTKLATTIHSTLDEYGSIMIEILGSPGSWL
jgi:hypothetical protein